MNIASMRAGFELFLPPGSRLVAAALKEDSTCAVVMVHVRNPEGWIVGVWAQDDLQGWGWRNSTTPVQVFGPEPAAFNCACVCFVEMASEFVRAYCSWAKNT